jgi:hypothetical protein
LIGCLTGSGSFLRSSLVGWGQSHAFSWLGGNLTYVVVGRPAERVTLKRRANKAFVQDLLWLAGDKVMLFPHWVESHLCGGWTARRKGHIEEKSQQVVEHGG